MNASYYESRAGLSEYLLFHYGKSEEVLPYPFGPDLALEFPVRCVEECVDASLLREESRALDLGCAVGRSSFELARFCAEVVGIDASSPFIEAAKVIQRDGRLAFEYPAEGKLMKRGEARLPEGVNAERVRFEQGDAMALRSGLGEFEVVLLANLIDRLSGPRRCLGQLPSLVRSGGQLIITSPYTWLEAWTPAEEWLGGVEVEGRERGTLEGLRRQLEPDFQLVGTKDMPFLIREHARKYQWSVAEASIWRRI